MPALSVGNPLQCSCLENPRDGGAWWAAIYGVAQSRTRLKRLSSSSSSPKCARKQDLGNAKNPTDGGVWWAAVYGVAQSRTRLKQLGSSRDYWGKACQPPFCNKGRGDPPRGGVLEGNLKLLKRLENETKEKSMCAYLRAVGWVCDSTQQHKEILLYTLKITWENTNWTKAIILWNMWQQQMVYAAACQTLHGSTWSSMQIIGECVYTQ